MAVSGLAFDEKWRAGEIASERESAEAGDVGKIAAGRRMLALTADAGRGRPV